MGRGSRELDFNFLFIRHYTMVVHKKSFDSIFVVCKWFECTISWYVVLCRKCLKNISYVLLKYQCINLIDSSHTISFSLSKCGSEVYCSLPFEKPRFFVWIAVLINRQLNSGFTSKSQRFGIFIVLIIYLRNFSCFSCSELEIWVNWIVMIF